MPQFDYAHATSVDEALRLLGEGGGNARALAGGTDLLVQLRKGARSLDRVVDVKAIPEMRALQWDNDKGLTVGAAVTCAELCEDDHVLAHYPALADAASLVGGKAIQSRATIGGNLCNAAPSADAIPVLMVVCATARIVGPETERVLPVADVCTGPGRTVLQPEELLLDLQLPPPKAGSGAAYLRSTPRHEMDIAVAGAGVWLELEGDTIVRARIALSAVAPTPLSADRAAAALVGQAPTDRTFHTAADLAAKEATPITDVRGSRELRRRLVSVLTRRGLEIALRRAKAE